MLITSLLLASQAHAFCGTYVGGAGSELYNEYSQVAIVREGSTTTLSIVNDVQGNFDEFALVVPVPEVLPEDAIHTLDPALFDRLDAYSEPRLVRYVCEDFEYDSDYMFAEGASDEGGSSNDTGGGVNVEAEYVIGEYNVVILSATESDALFEWLNDNGYAVPEAAVTLLGEYVEAGSYFFAAKVLPEAGISDGDVLSPLQFSYTSEVFSLPIRIGTLNSKSSQDLIVYGLNGYEEGQLKVANYPEIAIEDECMWDSEGESFGEFYAKEFEEAYDAAGTAVWTTEYAWGGGGCDPCTGTPPDPEDLVTLGVSEDLIHYSEYYFTRLHLRYTPAQASADLSLYLSGIGGQEQVRFIEYERFLEDRFPVCGLGLVDDPGSCDDEGAKWPYLGDGDGMLNGDGCGGSGCDASGGLAAGWGIAALLAGLRRRRRG